MQIWRQINIWVLNYLVRHLIQLLNDQFIETWETRDKGASKLQLSCGDELSCFRAPARKARPLFTTHLHSHYKNVQNGQVAQMILWRNWREIRLRSSLTTYFNIPRITIRPRRCTSPCRESTRAAHGFIFRFSSQAGFLVRDKINYMIEVLG